MSIKHLKLKLKDNYNIQNNYFAIYNFNLNNEYKLLKKNFIKKFFNNEKILFKLKGARLFINNINKKDIYYSKIDNKFLIYIIYNKYAYSFFFFKQYIKKNLSNIIILLKLLNIHQFKLIKILKYLNFNLIKIFNKKSC